MPPIKTQSNGLPEGVKILDSSIKLRTTESIVKPRARIKPEAEPDTPAAAGSKAPDLSGDKTPEPIKVTNATSQNPAPPALATPGPRKPRGRKPGRPKGRLDVPAAALATTAPAAAPIEAPAEQSATTESVAVRPRVRHRKATEVKGSAVSAQSTSETTEQTAPQGTDQAAQPSPPRRQIADIQPPAHPLAKPAAPERIHHVGVPPLHFGTVLALAVKTQFRHHHLLAAGLGAVTLATFAGLGAWAALSGRMEQLADALIGGDPRVVTGIGISLVLYYLGRSLGQGTVMYGVARDFDERPVGFGFQFGAAVNTFGRRLLIDLVFGVLWLLIAGAVATLVMTGASQWGVPEPAQMFGVFIGFCCLLYLWTTLSLSHGLASVAIILSKQSARRAWGFGLRLFSHRIELIGLKVLADVTELAFAAPLLSAIVASYVFLPAEWYVITSLLVAIAAGTVGMITGSGQATWWTALYRSLILVDHPNATAELFSGRQPAEASRGRLAAIVALAAILATLVAVLPWLKW